MEEFPPNRKTAGTPQGQKDVKQVVTGNVVRKKKSLRKQFTEVFVGGDARTAVQYTIFEVMVPAARDMIYEAVSEGFRNLMFGASGGRRRGVTPPQAGPAGYQSYQKMYTGNPGTPQRAISRQSRARHNFDEILLESRPEAETVLDNLYDILNKYDVVSVSDLYELVGITPQHTDQKWGWTTLQGAGVSRMRDGYLLNLPEPQPL